MVCPRCGHEVAPQANVCSNCGLWLKEPQGTGSPQAQQGMPPQQPQYPPQQSGFPPQQQPQYPPQQPGYQQGPVHPPGGYQQQPQYPPQQTMYGQGQPPPQPVYPGGQPVKQQGGGGCMGCFFGSCLGVIVAVLILSGAVYFYINWQIQQVLASMGSSDYESVEVENPATPKPDTAWKQLLAEKDPVTDRDAALQAFTLAVGPLPGVKTPTGPRQDIMSADGAVRWLRLHLDTLTPEQKAAYERYLNWEFLPEGTTGTPRGLASPLSEIQASQLAEGQPGWSLVYNQQYTDRALIYNQYYGNRFGQPLPYPIKVYVARQGRGPALPDADAWSESWDKDNTPAGVPTRCSIVLFPAFFKGSDNYQHMVMAHEVFHCYQAQMSPAHGNIGGQQKWIIEGMAEWAAHRASGGPGGKDNNWYPTYLTSPYQSLFTRAYDALGFYFHAEESGIDMWSKVKPMLLASSDAEAYQIVIGENEDRFTNSWASGYFRDRGFGDQWDMTGIGITPDKAVSGKATIANKKVAGLNIPAYFNGIYNVTSSADVTFFDFKGSARVYDGKNKDTYPLDGVYFCTKGECKCPDDDNYDGPPLDKLAPQSRLALTGGTSGSSGVIVGMKLDDFCKKRPKPTHDSTGNGELCAEIAKRVEDPMYPSMGPEEIRSCVNEYMDRFRRSMGR